MSYLQVTIQTFGDVLRHWFVQDRDWKIKSGLRAGETI